MQLDKEHKLVEQAKRSPEAFGIIFDMYYPKILAYCVRRTNDVPAAEQIVSQTFAKALKGLRGFGRRSASIEVWLFGIAIDELRIYFRTHRYAILSNDRYLHDGLERDGGYSLTQEALDAQGQLARHEQFVRAQGLINNLPEKYQDVIMLRFVEDKKITEIAQILHKKEGTVKSLLSRGLAHLRAELGKQKLQPDAKTCIVDDGGKLDATRESVKGVAIDTPNKMNKDKRQ